MVSQVEPVRFILDIHGKMKVEIFLYYLAVKVEGKKFSLS